MKRFGILLFSILLLFFAAGCSKDKGWKAQSAPAVLQGTGTSSGTSGTSGSQKPDSVTVSSFLHDLFGTELPKDTDRYLLPQVEEQRDIHFEESIYDGDVYGTAFYYVQYQVSTIFVCDLETEETRVFSDDIGNPGRVCTDADGVYIADYKTNEVVWFTFDGARAGSVPLPEKAKDNSAGPEGYRWGLEKYVSALRHYDGLLLLATRDAVWTIADGETEWKRADYSFIQYEQVDEAAILNRNRIVIYTNRTINGGAAYRRTTEMDRDGGRAKLLSEEFCNSLTASGGRLFSLNNTNNVSRMYDISADLPVYVQSVGRLNSSAMSLVMRSAVSGDTLFVLWAFKDVSLIPIEGGWDSVSLIAPASEIMRLEEMTNRLQSVSCQFRTVEDEAFFSRITTSLLSGEADFDVALISGGEEEVTTFLKSAIENGQYVDLNLSPDLTAHLNEAYSGFKDFLTVNGEIPMLPLAIDDYWFGFSDLAQDCGIPLPSTHWTLASLDAYAEKLKGSGEKYALFASTGWQKSRIVMASALSLIQSDAKFMSDSPGSGMEDSLKSFFAQLSAYRDAGVFSGDKAMFGAVGTRFDFMVKGTENYVLALPPSVGKHPVTVTSFLIINPKSEKKEQALRLLADLTNEENRYNMSIFSSAFFPGVTRYYQYSSYDRETDTWYDTPRQVPFVSQEEMPLALRLDAFFGTYYSASSPALITPSEKAWDAVSDFCTGKMTGEDCAKVLCEEFVYKLKG